VNHRNHGRGARTAVKCENNNS